MRQPTDRVPTWRGEEGALAAGRHPHAALPLCRVRQAFQRGRAVGVAARNPACQRLRPLLASSSRCTVNPAAAASSIPTQRCHRLVQGQPTQGGQPPGAAALDVHGPQCGQPQHRQAHVQLRPSGAAVGQRGVRRRQCLQPGWQAMTPALRPPRRHCQAAAAGGGRRWQGHRVTHTRVTHTHTTK